MVLLGAFEISPFDAGTNAIAKVAARFTKSGQLESIAGGGDTIAALNKSDAAKDFTYISTAGGASSNGWRARSFRASRHCGLIRGGVKSAAEFLSRTDREER